MIKQFVTNQYEWNETSLKMNLWETTNYLHNFHKQCCSLIWIHIKLSVLMKGVHDIGNKLILIKQSYTEDEFMINNNLIEAFYQTILYFDLEQQWIDRNNGNISRSWKQNDINKLNST